MRNSARHDYLCWTGNSSLGFCIIRPHCARQCPQFGSEARNAAADLPGADPLSAYPLFKRAEMQGPEGTHDLSPCRRYAEVY
jgi:hypothetical protein